MLYSVKNNLASQEIKDFLARKKQGPSQDCVDISNPDQVTHLLQRQKVGPVRHLSAVTCWEPPRLLFYWDK